MPTGAKLEKKNAYMAKLVDLVENKPQCIIVEIDFVKSKVMQHIRLALRGKCTLLMGKNTMIRTALRKRIAELEEQEQDTSGLQNLLDAVNGNMGFIFCEDGQMEAARTVMEENKIPAAAKAGIIAPCDVFIPKGNSGLEPAQTSFFQALNIPTKIVKGLIEITADVHLIKSGEKVGLSASALLAKLGVKPFEYGMKIRSVYQDGSVFDAAVLDITDAKITQMFMAGVANVAAFSREIGIPTEAALPHMICNAFKNCIALIADLDFEFEKAKEIKALLNDPEALAKMQAAAAAAATGSGGGAAAAGGAAEAKKEEVVEEEEDDMEFDLFD